MDAAREPPPRAAGDGVHKAQLDVAWTAGLGDMLEREAVDQAKAFRRPTCARRAPPSSRSAPQKFEGVDGVSRMRM